jgi:hypothetical protein
MWGALTVNELGIALAGVLVGALVSEALRYWRDQVLTKRRIRGSLRLIRHELAVTLSTIEEDPDPEDIRRRVKSKTIRTTQWDANEAVLAESLPQQDWLAVSRTYLGLRLMIAEIDGMLDDELVAMAKEISGDAAKAGAVVWSHDPAPRSNLINKLRGRV